MPYLPEVPVTRREGVPLTKAPAEKPQRGRAPKVTDADLPVVEEMVRAGSSEDAIAEVFDCSTLTVAKYLKAHGLKVSRHEANSPLDEEEVEVSQTPRGARREPSSQPLGRISPRSDPTTGRTFRG